MSVQYDNYLTEHKENVAKGFRWLQENIPEVIEDGFEWQICFNHDASKTDPEEYDAYDAYFYGNNRSYEIVQNFKKAWLRHIHNNPHHWQHWILINDEPKEGMVIIDMPYIYVVEMICDWWAFSWKKGDLNEIFGWYEDRKDYMKLSANTRRSVEYILGKMKDKLEEKDIDER
jgi:hypothetical protein